MLRFQLDLLVALDVMDAPLADLTFWAYRAITDTHRVQALPPDALTRGLRGELARVEARNAWLDWDEEDIKDEFRPWPE